MISLWTRTKEDEKSSVENVHDAKHSFALKIQNKIRNWLYRDKRLHRMHLSERLMFETNLLSGAQRFCLQLLIFALLIIALNLSSNLQVQRGLYLDLNSTYNFDHIQNTGSREEFISTVVPGVSNSSKKFFLQSTEYFVSGGAGSVSLNTMEQLFSRPAVLGGVALSVQVPAFSFTAWVNAAPDFSGGYIFRKRIVIAGSGSQLSCWGWYLHLLGGPQLHYGAHDFFPVSQNETDSSLLQEQVVLFPAVTLEPNTDMLLTMIISGNRVAFYRDLMLLGSSALPRKFTDCANNTEGVLVGDAGLALGQVRFYPQELGPLQIQEIFEGGTMLAEISTVSPPWWMEHPTVRNQTALLVASFAYIHI